MNACQVWKKWASQKTTKGLSGCTTSKTPFLLFSHICKQGEDLWNGACYGHWKGWLSFMFINLNICNKMENILNRPGSCAFLFRQMMTISKLRSPFTHNRAHRWQGSYLLVSTLTHTCHLLTAEAYTLHGTKLNCLDVILPESPSLSDSAASASLLTSLDVSLFFLALALCFFHFCLCPPRTWSFLSAELMTSWWKHRP